MRLKNTTDLPTPALRKLFSWVIKEIDLPAAPPRWPNKSLRQVSVRNCRKAFRGWANYGKDIGVSIGPANSFPANAAYRRCYQTETIKEFILYDRIEGLVMIAGHEIGHIRLGRLVTLKGSAAAKDNERNAETIARHVLGEFRKNKEALLKAWGFTTGDANVRQDITAQATYS